MELNTPIKLKVKQTECVSDAVTRYLSKYGYTPEEIETCKGIYSETMWSNGEELIRLAGQIMVSASTAEVEFTAW
jgi:hypothetical protein